MRLIILMFEEFAAKSLVFLISNFSDQVENPTVNDCNEEVSECEKNEDDYYKKFGQTVMGTILWICLLIVVIIQAPLPPWPMKPLAKIKPKTDIVMGRVLKKIFAKLSKMIGSDVKPSWEELYTNDTTDTTNTTNASNTDNMATSISAAVASSIATPSPNVDSATPTTTESKKPSYGTGFLNRLRYNKPKTPKEPKTPTPTPTSTSTPTPRPEVEAKISPMVPVTNDNGVSSSEIIVGLRVPDTIDKLKNIAAGQPVPNGAPPH